VRDALIAFMAATARAQAEATKEAQRAGIDHAKASLRDIADALNGAGIETPRGGEWHPASVARLLERLGAG
jgi:DNA invertase Pin-like site-specific DNA recombinase